MNWRYCLGGLVVGLISISSCLAAPKVPEIKMAINAAYTAVDIDNYIDKHKPKIEGPRTILPPQYIVFNAQMKMPPRAAKTEYVKVAMSVVGIADAPAINKQMLLVTPQGKHLPVYVEDALILPKNAFNQVKGRYFGYHIYTYSKGPAIVVSKYAELSK